MIGWQSVLLRFSACDDAQRWAESCDLTAQEAWEACERGDWLLWIAGRLEIDRKLLVQAACACARTALRFVPQGEERPLRAIETAEAWTRGEATIEAVRTARKDAWRARYANAAYTADAANAAYAAANAAAARAAAADVAYAAAYAADAAAYAAAAHATHAAAAAHAAAAHAAAAAADAAHAAAYDADATARAAHAARSKSFVEMAVAVRAAIPWSAIEQRLREVL